MRKELTEISQNPNFKFYQLDNAMYLDYKNGKTFIRKEMNNFGKSDFLQCQFYENGVLATITTYHEDYTGTFEDIMELSKKIIFINNSGKKIFEETIDVNNVKECSVKVYADKIVCKLDELTLSESIEEEIEM